MENREFEKKTLYFITYSFPTHPVKNIIGSKLMQLYFMYIKKSLKVSVIRLSDKIDIPHNSDTDDEYSRRIVLLTLYR